MTEAAWVWPSNEEINDFPDPLGFDREWHEWPADMAPGSDGPSISAEIFSREYIQNSWDSIQEQSATLVKAGLSVPDHGIEFRFVELTGADYRAFISAFGLDGHRMRYKSMSDKHRMDNRLGSSALITEPTDSVTILIAHERCGQGMFGPWRTGGKAGVVSRLKSALMHTRSEKDNAVAGGSWGHGKKAIANASKCRTIAVYTHFDSREIYPDDPAHTRFLGVSYWKSHDIADKSHVGIGLLGALDVSAPSFLDRLQPLENEEANGFIEKLGIPGLEVRRRGELADLGTTYLIVEPSFDANDLALAIERNWWPLLKKVDNKITVTDVHGNIVPVQPEERVELRPFLAAASLAEGAVDPRAQGDSITELTVQGHSVGTLALTSDDSEDGWSYKDPDENRTLVALVRNDMVIAYEPFPRKQRQKGPFLRGVLTVDREKNAKAGDLLRMSEPHLHNEWQTKESNAVPADSAKFAAAVLADIQKGVGALRATLKDEPAQVARRFSVFSKVFSEGKAPSVTKPPTPKPARRPYEIKGASKAAIDADPNNPTMVRATTSVEVTIAPHHVTSKGVNSMEVEIALGWLVSEESGMVSDPSLLDLGSVIPPPGFTPKAPNSHIYVGTISTSPVKFTWGTVYFPDDWRIAANPVVTDPNAEAATSDSQVEVQS